MSLWVLIVIALWPVAGLMVLFVVNRRLKRTRRVTLPEADRPGEILERMYLWPIVCWRIWRSLRREME